MVCMGTCSPSAGLWGVSLRHPWFLCVGPIAVEEVMVDSWLRALGGSSCETERWWHLVTWSAWIKSMAFPEWAPELWRLNYRVLTGFLTAELLQPLVHNCFTFLQKPSLCLPFPHLLNKILRLSFTSSSEYNTTLTFTGDSSLVSISWLRSMKKTRGSIFRL
jgi:hypothetical protein